MNAPEPCFQVNQLTPDPAVKFDRELADPRWRDEVRQ